MAGYCRVMVEALVEVAVTRAAPVPAPRIDHGVERSDFGARDRDDLPVRPAHQIA